MRLRTTAGIAAGAIIALAAWPFFQAHRSAVTAATVTPAPVNRDYERRNELISFYEGQAHKNLADQITGRMLAQQYMQRFRERYDMGDVLRAQELAKRSIVLQPQGNTSAQMTLASTYLAYHDFESALVHERDALAGEPYNANAQAQIASLDMELGRYAQARRALDTLPGYGGDNPTVDSIRARYDELTGDLPGARALLTNAIRTVDSEVDSSAYDRSWFHLRAGQLAFEAGDIEAARSEYDTSLDDFPGNAMTLMFRAKLERTRGQWSAVLADATRAAELYPLPQALGYEADAQRALGDSSGAQRTDALISVEQRLFNVQGVNDRLLAMYYAEQHEHLDDALVAARRDYARRGDEVYADDTIAWVLANRNQWTAAWRYAQRAVRLHTQDPELLYHAGDIAAHTGHRAFARALLQTAVAAGSALDARDYSDASAILRRL